MTPIRPSVSPGPTCRAIRCWVSSPGLLHPLLAFLYGKYRAVYRPDEIFMRHPVHPGDPWFVRKFAGEIPFIFLPLPLSIYLSTYLSLSLCFLLFFFCLFAFISIHRYTSGEIKRRLRDSAEIAKCATAVVQHTGRGGYFNLWIRENAGSMLLELMKSENRSRAAE